jgi:hypothetical protein
MHFTKQYFYKYQLTVNGANSGAGAHVAKFVAVELNRESEQLKYQPSTMAKHVLATRMKGGPATTTNAQVL